MEESLVVAIRDLRRRLYRDAAGTLAWTWSDGRRATAGYTVAWDPDDPAIVLRYRLTGGEDVRVRVWLEATEPPLGGIRWWFTCPLIVGGVPCRRRAGKLYLPPGGRYFGCRVCHGLTYRSCQESHQAERVFARLGLGPEVARLWSARHCRDW